MWIDLLYMNQAGIEIIFFMSTNLTERIKQGTNTAL